MPTSVDVSQTLPPLLKAKGWTQEKLADEAGIRRTDINAMVSRTRKKPLRVGPERLDRIARALGVSVLELGAPLDQADEKGRPLLAHLESLGGDLAMVMDTQKKILTRLARIEGRLVQLEGAPTRRPRPQQNPGSSA